VGSYQWAITIGLFLASCANQGSHARQDSGSYRIPIAIQFLWAIILSVGMFSLPETPRFSIMSGKHDEAARALSKLRRLPTDHPAMVAELNEIRANHEYEKSLGKSTYIDCFRGNMLKRQLTGCCLQALQQLAGINFIFYYGTHFFQQSRIRNPFIIALITNLVNVFATLPGLWLVEKAGRRSLLFWGAVGMCFSEMIVAIVGVTTSSEIANKVLIAFICLFIAFFAASWGPVAWVYGFHHLHDELCSDRE
jgi:SP family sugar:H+ symporter-like MFS transporter